MSAHNNSREVEIKFVVHDRPALESSLAAAGFQLKTPSAFESNTLFDDASGRLRQGGEVLRLRQFAGRWTLTYKSRGEAARHKTRTEHETEVASGEEALSILLALGYRPAFRYEKYRAEWTDGLGEVVIDHTPIGQLGEIEGPPDWIDRVASRLHLDQKDYITASYAELFFRWKQSNSSPAEHMTFADCQPR